MIHTNCNFCLWCLLPQGMAKQSRNRAFCGSCLICQPVLPLVVQACKKQEINLAFRSLIRIFAPRKKPRQQTYGNKTCTIRDTRHMLKAD